MMFLKLVCLFAAFVVICHHVGYSQRLYYEYAAKTTYINAKAGIEAESYVKDVIIPSVPVDSVTYLEDQVMLIVYNPKSKMKISNLIYLVHNRENDKTELYTVSDSIGALVLPQNCWLNGDTIHALKTIYSLDLGNPWGNIVPNDTFNQSKGDASPIPFDVVRDSQSITYINLNYDAQINYNKLKTVGTSATIVLPFLGGFSNIHFQGDTIINIGYHSFNCLLWSFQFSSGSTGFFSGTLAIDSETLLPVQMLKYYPNRKEEIYLSKVANSHTLKIYFDR